jgi:hypothetical protein
MVLKTELRLVQPKELNLALQMEKNCNNKDEIRRSRTRMIYRHTKTSDKELTLADPMELVLGSRKESHWVPLMVMNSVRSMALKTELRLVQPKEVHLALQMEKNCNNKDQIRRSRTRTIYRHTKTSDKELTLADPMELVLGSRKESHWVPPMVTNSVRSMALKTELRLVQPKELHLALQMAKNCNKKDKRSDCATKGQNECRSADIPRPVTRNLPRLIRWS